MKLRLHRDSLRLRLTPAEVAQLRDTGIVESITHFPTAALHCRLQTSRTDTKIAATLQNTAIQITIPHQAAHHWSTTDQVSLESTVPAGPGNSLQILIEKDFECLHGQPADPTETYYPNPAR